MINIRYSKQTFRWLLIALFLIWVFVIAGVFYVVQKPFTPQGLQWLLRAKWPPVRFSIAALSRTALDLLTALWLLLALFGAGSWPYRWLGLRSTVAQRDEASGLDELETVLFSLGLGGGLVGLLILALGLLGWLDAPILFGLVGWLTLVALPPLRQLVGRVHLDPPNRPISAYLLLTVGLGLTIALLPPTDWDGLFYHLTGPKLYLARGAIVPGIDIPHLNFPALFEMLFMLAMVIRGDVTAKLLHFAFGLLLAGLVYLLARRRLQLSDGWPAVLFLFSMPMVPVLAGWAYNDLALAFYQVAALYVLLTWHSRQAESGKQDRWLVLSGIFCGLAMSLKYTAFVAPITLGLLLWWWLWRQRTSFERALTASLQFGLPAILIALPWYLKNWVFTGNPVYPFVFDGRLWDAYRTAAYSTAGSGLGFDPLAWLRLPVDLTLGLRDANYIDGRTGPLFLVFLPLILLYGLFRYRRPHPNALNGLFIFALAQYLFWMLGVIWSSGLWQSRLLLPALVALCPALAWILHDLRHLNQHNFSLQRFLVLLVGVVLLLGVADQLFSSQHRTGWFFYQPLRYLAGSETRAEYLSRQPIVAPNFAAMQEINHRFPETAVVEFLWEPRSYYCQPTCRPDSILDQYGHLQYLYGRDAAAIAAAWRADGVTHILVNRLGLNFLLNEADVPPELRPDINVLNDLITHHLALVFELPGTYEGYRLK